MSLLVAFTLDQRRYALHLSAVERVVPVVDITPLPKAPDIVLGVVDVRGRIIPAINIRRRFGLPERQLILSDELIIARTSQRTVALLVDGVGGVVSLASGRVIAAQKIVPGLEYLEGIAKLDDGMILIHDLDTFLSLEEEHSLEKALVAS